MKRIGMLFVLVLCLTGCAAGRHTSDATTGREFTRSTLPPRATVPTADIPMEAEKIAFRAAGKKRIPYTGAVSQIRCITSPEALPAGVDYDADFFRDHALILITDSVGSGSVQVAIESISCTGDTAAVALSRKMSGNTGTSDMATWMLWAEVDANAAQNWILANPGANTGSVTS